MGRLLVAAAGAVIGSFFGAPQLGFLAGNLLGSVLFPEKGPEGPRLENLDVTSSAFGQMIPIGFGTIRVNGNIIQGDRLKEVKREGGKGMGGAEGTTYEYFWSGLVSFGEGPADEVLRIWADTKVVFDKRPQSGQKQKKPTFKFRVLLGGEDQLPDRYVITALGDETLAPAYRGQVCIVLDNIPVKDYGNRVPGWNAEIGWNATGAVTQTPTTFISGSLSGTISDSAVAVDWDRNRFYVTKQTSPQGIRQFSMTSMTETRQAEVALGLSGMAMDSLGYFYANGPGGNCKPINKINGDGIIVVDTFGFTDATPIENTATRFVAMEDCCIVQPIAPLVGIQDYLLSTSIFNDIGLLKCTETPLNTDMRYVWGGGSIGGGVQLAEDRVLCCAGPPKENEAFGYLLGRSTFGPSTADPQTLYELEVKANAQIGTDPSTGENITMVFLRNKGSFSPADISPRWDEFTSVTGFVADHTDDTVMFSVKGKQTGGDVETYFCKYDVHNSAFKWRTRVTENLAVNFEAGVNQSRVTDGRYAYISGSTIFIWDTVEGAYTTEAIAGIVEAGFQSYDGQRDAILVRTSTPSNSVSLILLGRKAASTRGLDEIVSNICARVGLEAADIDVSGLTGDFCRGYLVNQQTTGRGAIEPLAFGFLFDGVESDWVLKFPKRGQAPSFSIPQEDLVVLDNKTGEFFRETRGQEMELPLAVSINFVNKETDYQQGVARQKRIAKPTPAMFSKNESTTTLPIVFTQTEAKRLADIVLYQAWVERVTIDTQLSWEYLLLDPMDSVDINLDDGTTFHTRVAMNDAGVNMSIDVKGVTEQATGYSSTVEGDPGQFPQPPIPSSNETQMFIVDSPLIRDQDDAGGAYSLLFYAFGGYGQTGWPGAIFFKSADGTAFAQVGSSFNEVSWGTASNALAAPTEPFITDEINTLTVVMTVGSDNLSSVTQVEMLNGANRAWLTSQDGTVEVIGFRDVLDNGDGSFTLSGILRGDRGTDTMMGSHAAGDSFILLDASTVGAAPMTLSEVGLDRFFRGVPVGSLLQDGIRQTVNSEGRDLKPYRPVSVAAQASGSDIVLSWLRRSRLGGEMVDGSDSPILGEFDERYEVDIYNGPTVVRTLASTVETVTYLAANITTDFGGPQTALTVAVYQMSAAVGRGFSKTVTVDVEP